jgi:hypothetical protein
MMVSLPMEIAIISDTHMPRGWRRLAGELRFSLVTLG